MNMRIHLLRCAGAALASLCASMAFSAVLTVGAPGGPPTLVDALKAAVGGDTILIPDGDYGSLAIDNRAWEPAITIAPLNPGGARFEKIEIKRATKNVVIQGFKVWRNPGSFNKGDRVTASSQATGIVLDGLDIRGDADVSGYPLWSNADWVARNMKGLNLSSPGIVVRNSRLSGLGFAVVLNGDGAQFLDNTIAGYAMDGIRALGDGIVIRGNLVTDCVRVDGNHPDAIQSWSIDGKPVKGLVIDSNRIVQWTHPVKPTVGCDQQGIGFFDGFYDDLKITNNLVAVGAYHGISVYGGRGVLIANNTVVRASSTNNGRPWIYVTKHKNGTPARDVLVENNIGTAVKVTADAVNNVVSRGNVVLSQVPTAMLVSPATYDFTPVAGTRAEGKGASGLAPIEVAPVDPAPVEPAPVEPAPVDPAPIEVAPVEPAPVEPAPVDPAPIEVAPVEPAPVEPAPVEPAPVDPAPIEVAPIDPAPSDPAPAPVEPVVLPLRLVCYPEAAQP